MPNGVPGVSPTMTVLFALAIILTFLMLFLLFWYGWWISRREASVSPYSGMPLRRAQDISYTSKERILRYLHDLHQFENRIFEFRKAAFCRETGRIFQNCITWYDVIKIDWTFIQKRHPGHYVSWGSLNESQQNSLRGVHGSLEGFQTRYSSPTPSPRLIDPFYAFEKPGPLYVDVDTGTLVGWKGVPGTELEILIVQKPLKIIAIHVPQEK